jgi:enterobacterial common antigen flippase
MSSPSLDKTIALPAETPAATTETGRHKSYGQILKSSVLIGGSSVLTIGIGVIRTKAMALLLGPAGFGLTGLYLSILDLARTFSTMGVNFSGVRQIAAAVGSGDPARIARTVTVLRRASVVLGLLGALLLALFAKPIARFTFESEQYTAQVALLALAVLFCTISGGLDALIQGMRRIGDLARLGVYGASIGVVITITTVYFLRERGIVLALVLGAAASVLLSWHFSRRVEIKPAHLTSSEVRLEAGALMKLGFAFLVSSMMMMGSAYAIRTIILRHLGFDAAGFYQSAWALGGMYVGIVLQAMGADFFPRLSAVAEDDAECNRLANEQALISLLLAGPGVLATLVFAPLVIALFYSTRFAAAVEPLRWICLGMALRMVAWPIGILIIAKNRQVMFIVTDAFAAVVHVSLALLGVRLFGLNGAAMAYLGLYFVHCSVVYVLVRRLSGFHWSSANRRTGLLFLSLMGAVFCGCEFLPTPYAIGAGVVAVFGCGIYSLRTLCRLVPMEHVPPPVRRFLGWLPFVRHQ